MLRACSFESGEHTRPWASRHGMGFRQHLTKGDAHGTKVSATTVGGSSASAISYNRYLVDSQGRSFSQPTRLRLPSLRRGRGVAKKVGFPRGDLVRPLRPTLPFGDLPRSPAWASAIGVGLPMLSYAPTRARSRRGFRFRPDCRASRSRSRRSERSSLRVAAATAGRLPRTPRAPPLFQIRVR